MNRDIYQEVTDRIVAALERGVAPWVQPWSETGGMPTNAISGKPYRGINWLLLLAANPDRPSVWLTYRQARQLGGHVRRGERGVSIVFWRIFEEKPDDRTKPPRRVVLARSYTVFHWSQVEGVPREVLLRHLAPRSAPEAWQLSADAEGVVARSGAVIRPGEVAGFIRNDDCIIMPARERFADADNYAATLFHELTHWTGHPSRLARDLGTRFGSEAYAVEELVAELGSAFLCAQLGIAGRLQHAEYLASWLRVLQADKRAIFTTSAHAQRAADYLLYRAANAPPTRTARELDAANDTAHAAENRAAA